MGESSSEENCSHSTVLVEWEPGQKILRVTWIGDVSLRALNEQIESFRRRPFAGQLKGMIVDFRLVRNVHLTAGELATVAEHKPVFPAVFPRAMVAEQDLHFGLLRMYESMSAETQTETTVVRSLEEAYSLFKLQEPVFEPLPPAAE
ncbi:MAG: hypothetical protein P4M01_13950 [Acidobacteriota bacterium]|nr:hypothetical protein [Acidobacteriota bacterium]